MTALLETPGRESHQELLALADESALVESPDRFRQLAKERAVRDSEAAALEPSAVVDLEARLEAPPSTRDQLFDVMVDRLEDYQHDLAHHDFTIRRTLQAMKVESEAQVALAARLQDYAKSAYTVHRETEVADFKEPDIRLTTASGQVASIEVKIADSWSIPQLEAALSDQLVGQYLRHVSGQAGALVLFYRGTKSYWEDPDNGTRLSFDDVVRRLLSMAERIEASSGNSLRLGVYRLGLTY